MPSQRRMRLLMVAAIALICMCFYYSGEASKIQNQKFYRSTLEAMRVKEAAKQALAAEKAHDPVGAVSSKNVASVQGDSAAIEHPAIPPAQDKEAEMEEIPIAGRTRMSVPKKGSQDSLSNSGVVEAPKEQPEEKEEDPEHENAKDELNTILKQAPVIVFSKSYCPFSKKAKTILLDHYSISPAPYVIELDQHPLGAALQQLLAQNTGRRTVPNVLVNGKSIGGGDDIAALDQSDELASTLRQLGGKWISDVSHKTPELEHL